MACRSFFTLCSSARDPTTLDPCHALPCQAFDLTSPRGACSHTWSQGSPRDGEPQRASQEALKPNCGDGVDAHAPQSCSSSRPQWNPWMDDRMALRAPTYEPDGGAPTTFPLSLARASLSLGEAKGREVYVRAYGDVAFGGCDSTISDGGRGGKGNQRTEGEGGGWTACVVARRCHGACGGQNQEWPAGHEIWQSSSSSQRR